jgi:GH25 family lysozyme M1 (1,4-beta-N-acetylmuramidase)
MKARLLVVLLLALCAPAVAPHTAAALENGKLPPSVLSPIYGATDNAGKSQTAYLRKGPVAASFNTLNLCADAQGIALSPGPSNYRPAATAYRSYDVQVILKRLLGRNAATPGFSNHGWAFAIDIRTIRMQQWINIHGPPFGWSKRTSDAPWEGWHFSASSVAKSFKRPDPGASFRFPNLEVGSGGPCQGPAVKEAQRRLGVAEDGEFGKASLKALHVFEREHHMKRTNRITSVEWLRLRKAGRQLANGHDPRNVGPLPGQVAPVAGQDVRAVQGLLNQRFDELNRHQYRVTVDGVTDAKFVTAVRRFQVLVNRRGAKLKVTGIVNDATYAWLIKSFAPPQVGKRYGPDISVHQGSIDAKKIKAAGATFIIQKIGEGQDFIDKTFTTQRVHELQAAKFPFGVSLYHYLHPKSGRSGSVEAAFALKTALSRGWRPKDGVLWADLETTTLGPSGTCAYIESFENYLVLKGVRTGVYTFPGFAHQFLGSCSRITARASWRAHYGAKVPDPFPWRGMPVLWQLTDHWKVNGISGDVDMSIGDAQNLVHLVGP